MNDSVLVIRGDRIMAAGPAASTTRPARCRTAHRWPRTVDHARPDRPPYPSDIAARDQHRRVSCSDAAAAIRATQTAASMVDAGITAVRDPGTIGRCDTAAQGGCRPGLVPGPRIFWVGSMIAMTSGHGDEATSTATGRWKPDLPSTRTYTADGPWEWRKAVREQIRRHADWIKRHGTLHQGGDFRGHRRSPSRGAAGGHRQFRRYTDWAIEAGVDSVEHTLNVLPDQVALMARHKTAWGPNPDRVFRRC